MVGVAGEALTGEERRRLAHPAVGGVLLFTRNFSSRAQLTELTRDIHSIKSPPVLIAVDQEGGRVQRFRGEFTELPAAGALRALYQRDPHETERAAEDIAWLMARELRGAGVDVSFAPVLDLDRGISRVIGDRAFHRDPDAVSRLGQAWARGMREAGMVAVGKHFPGHGGCAPDSHVEMPVDDRRFADIEAEDLVPFRRLIDNGLEAVMVAHIRFPRVDEALAGFSRRWLMDVLRRRLGFEGAIFSDDMGMAASEVAGTLRQRTAAALDAGCDMVVVGNERDGLDAILADPPTPPPASAMRLARLHGRGQPSWEAVRAEPRWRRARERSESIIAGHSGELEL